MRPRSGIGVVLLGCLAIASEEPASAAPPAEGFGVRNEVLDRPHPGLDPIGIRVAGWTLIPSLTVSIGDNDNVFASDVVRRKSAEVTLAPTLMLQSNWSVHEADIIASGVFQRDTHAPQADFDQYGVAAHGRLDVAATAAVDVAARYMHGVEPKGSPGDVYVAGDPSTYQTYGASTMGAVSLGRLALAAGVDLDQYRYNPVRVGDVAVSQIYRDRTSLSATGRAGLAIGPSLTGYAQIFYDRLDYRVRVPGEAMDSSGWRVLGGADFELTKLISARAGIGYIRRNYANTAFRPVSGFNYSGAVLWNVTTLVTLTFGADRSIVESPQVGVSGVLRDHGDAGVDYEILRRLIATARVDYYHEHYRGLDRIDDRAEVNLGFRYLANRFAELGLKYRHLGQNGHGLFGRSYSGNVVAFSVTIQK